MIRELNLIVEWLLYSILGCLKICFLAFTPVMLPNFAFRALMLLHYSQFTDAWPSFSSGGTYDQVH